MLDNLESAVDIKLLAEGFEALPLPVAICDSHGRILFQNRLLLKLHELGNSTPADNIEVLLASFREATTIDGDLASLSKAVKRRPAQAHLSEASAGDGNTYRISVKPLAENSGDAACFLWSFANISDERASMLGYARIYDKSAIGIFRSSPEGRYISANPAGVRLHGYDSESEMLQAVADISTEVYVDPEDRETLTGLLQQQDSVLGFESQIYRHKTGQRCWVRQNIWKVFDATGQLLYLEGHVEDIDEHKTFEQSLNDKIAARTAQLEEAIAKLRDEIEERTHVEAALKDSETRFKQIFEAASDWYWEMDAELRYSHVSERFKEITGLDPGEYIGKTRSEYHGGDQNTAHWLNHKDDLDARRPFRNFRIDARLPNGEWTHSSISGVPIFGDDGAFLGYRGTGSDVTARVKAERLLAEREVLLRSIVDNTPSVIVVKDLEGRFVFVNDSFVASRGGTVQGWIGKKAYAASPSDHAAAMRAQDQEAMEKQGAVTRERKTTLLDGKPYHRIVTKFPVNDAAGTLIGVATISTDVAELYEARRALEKSEAQLRAIVDNMPALVSLKDTNGRLLIINKEFQSRTGLEEGDLVGKTITELGFETQIVEHLAALDCEVIETGRVIVQEDDNVVSEKPYTRSLTKFPVFDTNGEILGVGTVSVDISDRKAVEAQLQQAQKMEVVGQLTGGVAHDFNNLLGVIVGNLDILNEALADDANNRILIDAALRAALRGAELTNRLLAFSRKQSLRPETTDLNSLILGMTDMLRRTLGETISIRTVAATDLWRTNIDPAQLEAALLNLTVNARHAMAKGGELLIETANVEFDRDYAGTFEELEPGQYAMLSVSDIGVGIPSDVLEHVFEPFFTTKGVGEGSGLGLSMVHGFVKQSGGHIEIQSEEGAGTAVRMYLPLAGEGAPEKRAVRKSIVGPRGQGELILVVEDDPDLRALAVATISGLGYRTLEAFDGASALDALDESQEIDLLFTDVILPGGMNGVALGEAALGRRPSIKVLYTSGYTENAAAHNSILRSGDKLLTKPYRREILAERLLSTLTKDAAVGT